uniref:Ubiquitin fusion degradation protein UFD1 N-terminal subdomain 2 domain-containing protein n=1 Tax=Globisporangium ultimum (strain ATCC 200006 / CBS 805.95 / DAOM BR144) TaxID=431595 RepID=K3WD15_GLOUD
MAQLEFGDKIVLPQAFLPYWMMQNLHVDEGGFVLITNAHDISRGIYCRLQPEETHFLTLAADVGPKLLMENAMRRYSVLSVNETIVIEYGATRYFVRVVELKPASVISLCGDVDLEMDFTAPEL